MYAYLGVAQYLATFWYVALSVPLFGLIAVLFGQGLLKTMGFMGLLWPISLPARAILATSKVGKLMEKGVYLTLEEDVIYFHSEEGTGMKLKLADVRYTQRRRGFLVFVLRRFAFVGVPLHELPEPFLAAVESKTA